MILLCKLIFITSLWTLAIKIATSEGMVFEKLGKYGEKKVKEGYKIFEALWVCQWCMPSIHASIGMAFAFGLGIIQYFTWNLLIYYVLTVCGSSLVNGLIWGFHLKQNAEKECMDSVRELADIMIENSFQGYDEGEIYEGINFSSQHN